MCPHLSSGRCAYARFACCALLAVGLWLQAAWFVLGIWPLTVQHQCRCSPAAICSGRQPGICQQAHAHMSACVHSFERHLMFWCWSGHTSGHMRHVICCRTVDRLNTHTHTCRHSSTLRGRSTARSRTACLMCPTRCAACCLLAVVHCLHVRCNVSSWPLEKNSVFVMAMAQVWETMSCMHSTSTYHTQWALG